jgi:hypothetical protein
MYHGGSEQRGIMATKRRFGIGDEVNVKGIVRLIDVAGPGTITIELLATGTAQRITVREDNDEVELVGKAPPAPKGRQKPLL